MNILEFIQKFPDEDACRLKIKEQRDQIGVICHKCNCKEHFWLENKQCYECKHCHSRQSLRSGTVMQNSKLPFRYWFVTMHLLTSTKKSFSTEELRRQLGHKRYQPIWEMVNKIRDIMGKRDNEYQLTGQMELDDAYLSTEIPQEQKDKPLKRGRGSQSKTKVLVMAESEFVDNPKKGRKPKRVNHIKMQVISDLKSNTITSVVKEQVDKSTELVTDDSTSYTKLIEHVNSHVAKVIEPDMIPVILPDKWNNAIARWKLCGMESPRNDSVKKLPKKHIGKKPSAVFVPLSKTRLTYTRSLTLLVRVTSSKMN